MPALSLPSPHSRHPACGSVPCGPCGGVQIVELVTIFKGEVVDVAENSLTVEVSSRGLALPQHQGEPRVALLRCSPLASAPAVGASPEACPCWICRMGPLEWGLLNGWWELWGCDAQVTGDPGKMVAVQRAMSKFTVKQLVRTGKASAWACRARTLGGWARERMHHTLKPFEASLLCLCHPGEEVQACSCFPGERAQACSCSPEADTWAGVSLSSSWEARPSGPSLRGES